MIDGPLMTAEKIFNFRAKDHAILVTISTGKTEII